MPWLTLHRALERSHRTLCVKLITLVLFACTAQNQSLNAQARPTGTLTVEAVCDQSAAISAKAYGAEGDLQQMDECSMIAGSDMPKKSLRC